MRVNKKNQSIFWQTIYADINKMYMEGFIDDKNYRFHIARNHQDSIFYTLTDFFTGKDYNKLLGYDEAKSFALKIIRIETIRNFK